MSEAIRLRFDDITPDGLVIRCTKFRKSLMCLCTRPHRLDSQRYLQQRRPYAPFDEHVFVSLRRKPLRLADVEKAFRTAVKASRAATPAPGNSTHAGILAALLRGQSLADLPRWPRCHHPTHVGVDRPTLATARRPTRIGIWKPCQI